MLENFDYNTIEKKIGVEFKNKDLLLKVFTHTSYANEKNIESNENLEYLGDSILGFVVADMLFRNYNETVDEGKLSQVRSKIVCTDSLLEVSDYLDIAKYLLSSNQTYKNGNKKLKQYGDLIEALIAGIYLDQGLSEARKFIERAFKDIIVRECFEDTRQVDYKTDLQELLQKKKSAVVKIDYKFENRIGEDHDPEFTYSCLIDGEKLGSGIGKNKKTAQAMAAKEVIDKIMKGRKGV